ncbi:MAG: glycosyltransferase family 2 protein [Candidatus Woesearchaeota archaeon]
MIRYILWGVSFITLYVSLVWLSFMYLNPFQHKRLFSYPSITVVIPAYNEERTVVDTIKSVASASYPKGKLSLVVVNDGSTDHTSAVAKEYIRSARIKNAIVIDKPQSGKAAALNTALKSTSTELFACVDADSLIDKHALLQLMHHFEDPKNAAVITALKVYKPKKLLEKVQHFEYLLGIITRKIRSSINTLAMTPWRFERLQN